MENDNLFKRMIRGFKVMYEKLVSSKFVQHIKEQEEISNPNEFSTDLSNLEDL